MDLLSACPNLGPPGQGRGQAWIARSAVGVSWRRGAVTGDGNRPLPARLVTREATSGQGAAREEASVICLGRACVRALSILPPVINRSAPPATVTPVLIYPDVRAAVAWLEAAFGFRERVRIGEAHRSQMGVGPDGAIVVADVRGEQAAPTPGAVTHIIKVRVEDADRAFARAVAAGARPLQEPVTYEYGERTGLVQDLAGHRWELSQTVRDVEPEEWGGVTVASW